MMTSGLKLRIARRARADYRAILRYTKLRWGVDQQQVYARQLTEGMETIRANPGIGRSRSDIEEGLRSHPLREHMAFYLITGQSVTIIRILHHRMDAVAAFHAEE